MEQLFRDNVRIGNLDKVVNQLHDRYGKSYDDYRLKWAKTKELSYLPDFPIQMDIDTIDSCNLNCKYCNARNNFPRRGTNLKISKTLVDALFDELSNPKGKDKLCAIDIGYLGEPLLNQSALYEIIQRSDSIGLMEKYLHTNGQLLTLDIFKNMMKCGLTHLFVSIDAATDETYLKLRGGSLQKVVDNINVILDYKKINKIILPGIRVSFVYTPQSAPEAKEFIKFWEGKVDIIDFQTACDWISPIKNKNISMRCPQPWQRMSIGPRGELNPCCAAVTDELNENQRIGIFPDISIYDAWNGKKANELRTSILRMELNKFPFCEECHIRTSPVIM